VLRQTLVALVATAAAAGALAAAAFADGSPVAPCGATGYSYAGVRGSAVANGVAATLSAETLPIVQSGHVAAWVGVGGAGLGPGGSTEWIQAGLAAFPDGRNELYYEVALPDEHARYVKLGNVAQGARYRVAVLEVAGKRGYWRVFVNNRAATDPILLPGSHGIWTPVATSESWDGGQPACNRFDYAFDSVSFAAQPGGAWRTIASRHVLQDPGYSVTDSATGFVAHAV
jgi:hypothetical protein